MKPKTFKTKLREAEYFLDQLSTHYGKDSEIPEYYLNAFVIACRSSLDYVIQDFLISLKIKMQTNDFKNNKKRSEQLSNHPNYEIIENFYRLYDEQYDKLLKDPLMSYFIQKRNNIAHKGLDGNKMYFFKQEDGKPKEVYERRLEVTLDYFLKKEKFEGSENIDELFRMAPYFKDQFKSQIEFEIAIRELDMKPFLKKYLQNCYDFANEFYNEN